MWTTEVQSRSQTNLHIIHGSIISIYDFILSPITSNEACSDYPTDDMVADAISLTKTGVHVWSRKWDLDRIGNQYAITS